MTTTNEVTQFTDVIYRGAIRRYEFNHVKTDGSVQSVAGWTAKMTWRRTERSTGSPIIEVDGVITGDGSTGQMVFSYTRVQTQTIPVGKYVVSVFRTNLGSEDLLAEGEIECKNSIYDAAS